jgi:chemotaxis family two-component system response regulator Rcp1
MNRSELGRPIEILLVEDNPGDAELTAEALRHGKVYASVPRPDVVLLDLNLPRKDGREVLAEIKADDELKQIPVIVLTTSEAEEDILRAYNLAVNCYITKPVDLDQFIKVVKAIEDFWFTVVKLPPSPTKEAGLLR